MPNLGIDELVELLRNAFVECQETASKEPEYDDSDFVEVLEDED